MRPLHEVLLVQDVERPRGIGDNGGPPLEDVIDELRQALPPIFLGSRIDEFTGGAIHWPTVQNRRSLREIPDECFVRSGQRVLVRRDLFLDWWATTLSDARQTTPPTTPPRRRPAPVIKSGRRGPDRPRKYPVAADASPAEG